MRMLSKFVGTVLVGALAVAELSAFVLHGPGDAEGSATKAWQNPSANGSWGIGYALTGDIGGPVFREEAYRWNVPFITYAFDESFRSFFGEDGIRAVEAAFAVFNDLPAASQMSEDLSEFPLTTLRRNYEAAQLGLSDIKSVTMTILLEQMGLTEANRWVWALHGREVVSPTVTEYEVIQYNYDPVTREKTPYVNETLFTYAVQEYPAPGQDRPFADAVEVAIPDPLAINWPVTSFAGAVAGNFFTGLSRDDVGGLRFLLHPRNIVAETLLPGSTPGPRGWTPFVGTNFFNTNNVGGTNVGGTNITTAAYRGGVNKIRFRKIPYDPLSFRSFTNSYTERVYNPATGESLKQSVLRPILNPDIIFTVEDIDEFVFFRTSTASWINNDALTPAANLGGPGIIQGPITISFNMLAPALLNDTPGFATEALAIPFLNAWASYDGTTNAPIVFPSSDWTIQTLRELAERAGGF
jgi:hypothetical protein